jgi:hypothetical protein
MKKVHKELYTPFELNKYIMDTTFYKVLKGSKMT